MRRLYRVQRIQLHHGTESPEFEIEIEIEIFVYSNDMTNTRRSCYNL